MLTNLPPVARARMLIVIAVIALATAVWSVTAVQRSAAETTFRQSESAQLMLAGMLDQQTGVRGFALTGQERFLAPYHGGRRFYRDALAEGHRASREDRGLRRSIDELDRTAKQWQRLAVVQIEQIGRKGPRSITNAEIDVRKKVLDRFRRENNALRAHLGVTRAEQLSRAGSVAVTVVLLLSVLFGGVVTSWCNARLALGSSGRRRLRASVPSGPSSPKPCSSLATSTKRTASSSVTSSAWSPTAR